MEKFEITRGNKSQSPARFGYIGANFWQLGCHFVLAVFIGISLRLTTFNEATTIAAVIGDDYRIKTSFLVSFGFTKAVSNLIVGHVSDAYGRKMPHTIGWVFGILLGIVLLVLVRKMSGDDRESWIFWHVLANICLGAQQGWTWTTNIFMFMDISGPRHRALSSGISNSVGYLSSAVAAYVAATISTETAFRIVLGTSALGWTMSTFLVRDTSVFVEQEINEASYAPSKTTDSHPSSGVLDEWDDEDSSADVAVDNPSDSQTFTILENQEKLQPADSRGQLCTVFAITCWRNKSTAILCVGGLSANLITSFAWGIVLIWGKEQGLSSIELANIGAAFTFTKGIMMFISGYISDRQQDRKRIVMGGFTAAIIGLLVTAAADSTTDLGAIMIRLLLGGIIIGSGIGSVYCVMTAALSDHTPPQDRASAIGVYKFWRDSGYAFGGLLTGWIADASGGSFVVTTLVVTMLVGGLVIGIGLLYREADGSRRVLPSAG